MCFVALEMCIICVGVSLFFHPGEYILVKIRPRGGSLALFCSLGGCLDQVGAPKAA